jgi:hypothetical protein
VLNKDLAELSEYAEAGILRRSRRGDYEVWLAWDGKDSRGKLVASGVYTFRIWGRFEIDGTVRTLNKTIKEGMFRRKPLP